MQLIFWSVKLLIHIHSYKNVNYSCSLSHMHKKFNFENPSDYFKLRLFNWMFSCHLLGGISINWTLTRYLFRTLEIFMPGFPIFYFCSMILRSRNAFTRLNFHFIFLAQRKTQQKIATCMYVLILLLLLFFITIKYL